MKYKRDTFSWVFHITNPELPKQSLENIPRKGDGTTSFEWYVKAFEDGTIFVMQCLYKEQVSPEKAQTLVLTCQDFY